MRRWIRALMTLLAAGAAGFLLWFAPHFQRWSTGGYWGVVALMTVAGVLIGLSQLHARDGNPAASFLVAFLPVLVATGWVILAVEPQGNWVRDHVLSWSGDMGIGHAVHNLGEHVMVLAFGLGIVFGVTFEPRMVRRGSKQADTAPVVELTASNPPPVSADPGWEEPTAVEPSAPEQHEDAVRTVELAASSPQPVSAGLASEEPTVVEPVAPHQQEDAAATVELAASNPQPVSADPAWPEATAVEPPARQQQEDAAPTVETAASDPRPVSADPAEEELTAVETEPAAVDSPAPEPEGSDQGPIPPPA
jgi:hypothetical protein